ncbi:malonate--CoA ligase [Rhodovibrionaceae bacterium A322]
MNENLYALLQSRFPADRSQPVIEQADGTQFSYGHLEEMAGRYAALLKDLGVKPGDRIAIQTDKSPNALFFYLGCEQAGAVYLPLNTAYTQAELAYFLGDATPALVLCRPDSETSIKEVAAAAGVAHVRTMDADGGGSLTDEAMTKEPLTDIEARSGDDLAAICYTSGTTGRSKGAMLTHANLASNAFTLHKLWGFKEGDVLLHALPIFHVHGLFVAINTTLANGSKMIFLPKFDADQVVSLLPKATVMMGVPTFYTRLLAHSDFNKELTAHMRLFISGSAPLLAETFEQFEEVTGQRILERYGMSEAGMITSNPYVGTRCAGTVGFALPDVEVRIADNNGQALPVNEVGILEAKGPNIFKGYWQMPEKTAAEFRNDGFFITGDMAKVDDDGYIHIVGRSKDLIISGGFNVYPKEVELVIDETDGVGESAVIGVPHPDFGEGVVAVATRTGDVSEDTIISRAREQLAAFKAPKKVYFIDELPRNTMGKVQKNQLRDQFKGTFSN